MTSAAGSSFNTILIPVDGSPEAEEAVRSIRIFTPPERVLLLHAVSVPHVAYPGTGMSVGQDFSALAEKHLRQKGASVLEKAAALLPHDCGQVSQHLEMGNPAELILSMAQDHYVNLILLGSRGLGPVREYVLGSVSYRVATHARCPVLLTKTPMAPLARILLPIEHPQDAEGAMGFLSCMPFRDRPLISVLHVMPFTQPALPTSALLPVSWKQELEDGARRLVQGVVDQLENLGYSAEGLVEPGPPSAVIQEQVSHLQPQLVLMSPRPRSLPQRLVQGSVSHATMHHADCSLLLIHHEIPQAPV